MSPVLLNQKHPTSDSAVHDREMRRYRHANRSRSRSRSRSFERGVGVRDRNVEKVGGGGGGVGGNTQHMFRNKSPPSGASSANAADRRSYERRSDGRRGNGNNNSSGAWKSRSRSPERWPSNQGKSTLDISSAAKSKRQRCRDFEGELLIWMNNHFNSYYIIFVVFFSFRKGLLYAW